MQQMHIKLRSCKALNSCEIPVRFCIVRRFYQFGKIAQEDKVIHNFSEAFVMYVFGGHTSNVIGIGDFSVVLWADGDPDALYRLLSGLHAFSQQFIFRQPSKLAVLLCGADNSVCFA